MEKVISQDGTLIAFHRRGGGPPLILVAGTGAANPTAWTAVIPTLEEHFMIYAVDRRGRGESGDSPNYALEQEFEDIAAVGESVGQPANLLGHSFGGLCALEAAVRMRNLRKLILYEPYFPAPGEEAYPKDLLEQMEAMLNAGDREGVLREHYLKNVGMTMQEYEQMKSSPAWSMRLATAHTLPREMRGEAQYRFDAGRFQAVQTPTLLLGGSDSTQFNRTIDAISGALPNCKTAVMPGQGHLAMYTAPDLFLREVLGFLLAE